MELNHIPDIKAHAKGNRNCTKQDVLTEQLLYRDDGNCSMHFRYMEIELLFPAIALAFIWQEGTKEQLEMRRREGSATGHPAVKRAISQVLFVLLLAFCMLSTAMTAVWCLL